MSRYSVETIKDGARYIVSYGYDDPLTEYFLHVEHADAKHTGSAESAEDDNPELLFAISSYHTLKCHPDYPGKTHFSNSEILELMQKWGVPKEAQSVVAMDERF